MRTDGRADVTKLIGAFRNFVKAPKNGFWLNSVLWISSKICRNITIVVFVGLIKTFYILTYTYFVVLLQAGLNL